MRPILFWSLCLLTISPAVAVEPLPEPHSDSAIAPGSDQVIEPSIDPVHRMWEDAGLTAGPWWHTRSPADRMGVEIGVLGLRRERPDAQVLAVDGGINPILNATQFRGDMQFGLNTKVDFYRLWNALGGTDLQFGYFGINSMDSTATVNATEVLSIFFNSVPAAPRPSTSDFIYSTNIYSGEANLRFLSARRFRPIVGLRYIKVEEQFDIYRIINGTPTGGFSRTNNSMFGGQFGIEGSLWRWRGFDWTASGKYGAMHNKIYGHARAADSTGTGVVRDYNDNTFSSLAEVQTGVRYSFVSGLEFVAAYQCLFISDLALGLDQSRSIALLLPLGSVDLNSQLYQGVNFSTVFSF